MVASALLCLQLLYLCHGKRKISFSLFRFCSSSSEYLS